MQSSWSRQWARRAFLIWRSSVDLLRIRLASEVVEDVADLLSRELDLGHCEMSRAGTFGKFEFKPFGRISAVDVAKWRGVAQWALIALSNGMATCAVFRKERFAIKLLGGTAGGESAGSCKC